MQNFLKSYLSKRQQWVISGNVYSNFAEVEYGVPQGSVLGTLIFLVYISDIDDYCSQNCLTLYADDTVVKQKMESITEVFSQSLSLVSDYLIKNKLTMNYEKTCFMNMKARRRSLQEQIKIKELNLTQRSSLKYLGLESDDNLKFCDHTKNLCSKRNQFSGLFYRLRSILTFNQLLLTFKVYVQPVVSYGVLVYGTSNKTLILPLESKLKQITRIIFKKPKSTSTCLERESNHLYSIRVMHLFELLQKLAEILRAECHIDCLTNVITRKEIETLQAKRVQSRQLKTANKSSGLSPKRLEVRIRKLLNFI